MSEKTFQKGVSAPKVKLDGSGLRVAIVHTRWNYALVDLLYKKVYDTLVERYNVKPENIHTDTVSGSYELPMAAKQLIELSQSQASQTANDLLGSPAIGTAAAKSSDRKTGPFDAVICIGLVIKGGTAHFEYICDAVTHGIMRVQLDTGVPVVFGVLTCYNDEQAIARSSTEEGFHHAEEWAAAAIESGLRKYQKL
ncbi:6,7-dimethyl-8-ribityllumazine synthase [Blakeslea trispora]|nr:6,7-dimethyl-8-ribityllumazine synthase [Blakeslea trispora]